MRRRTLAQCFICLALVCIFSRAALIKHEQIVSLDNVALTDTESQHFLSGFMASIYVIIISELGDKTFFIAAILAIDHPRLVVYLGAMLALITMTILSALMGYATEILPRVYTFYLSGILFIIFGLKMLKDGYYMNPEDSKEEYHDVEQEISGTDISSSPTKCIQVQSVLRRMLSPIFVEAFLMTFLAEWGDRSQLTTIILAAREDVFGVIAGGILGHGLCTGLAVLAGRLVSQRIPVKWLTLIGGVTFILFGIVTFLGNPNVN